MDVPRPAPARPPAWHGGASSQPDRFGANKTRRRVTRASGTARTRSRCDACGVAYTPPAFRPEPRNPRMLPTSTDLTISVKPKMPAGVDAVAAFVTQGAK